MIEKECLACGFIVELNEGITAKQCPSCNRYYEKVSTQIDKGHSFKEITPISKKLLATIDKMPIVIEAIASHEKKCPFYSELIEETAKNYKHWNEILDVVLRAADDSKKTQNVFVNSSSAAVAVMELKNFPHVMHLILTIITAGAWAIIWIIHHLLKGR
ncbi:MAG: hypothetical protein QM500_11525 [Methylococcales bacterium]